MELKTDLMMEWRKMVEVKKKQILCEQERTLVFWGKLKPAIEVTKNVSLVMRTRTPLKCKGSLRSKRFRASLSRKFGREQKKRNDPFHLFFCSRSNFRAITRLETLATQANVRESKIVGFQIPRHGSRIPGQNSSL